MRLFADGIPLQERHEVRAMQLTLLRTFHPLCDGGTARPQTSEQFRWVLLLYPMDVVDICGGGRGARCYMYSARWPWRCIPSRVHLTPDWPPNSLQVGFQSTTVTTSPGLHNDYVVPGVSNYVGHLSFEPFLYHGSL